MTLLALLCTSTPVTPAPQLPYPIPTTAPYNVTQHATTPTDDGTGHSIHPSVVDFGTVGWNGHRFWMTTTAFYIAENARENPHVYHSDNGIDWEWPDGVVNPLDAWPGAATNNTYWYNSDSHLAHDPDTDRLILTWREVQQQAGGKQTIWARTSLDGSTWTPEVKVHEVTDDGGTMSSVSQSLVRVSSTEWRMYFVSGSGGAQWMRYLTATDPLGPYSGSQSLTLTGPIADAYHGDVTRLPDGRYLSVFMEGSSEYPGLSIDGGVTFTMRSPILTAGTYGGNPQSMYKASAMLDALDPTIVGVWYTTHGTWGRWICYTRIPLSAWTG